MYLIFLNLLFPADTLLDRGGSDKGLIGFGQILKLSGLKLFRLKVFCGFWRLRFLFLLGGLWLLFVRSYKLGLIYKIFWRGLTILFLWVKVIVSDYLREWSTAASDGLHSHFLMFIAKYGKIVLIIGIPELFWDVQLIPNEAFLDTTSDMKMSRAILIITCQTWNCRFSLETNVTLQTISIWFEETWWLTGLRWNNFYESIDYY
jgi:hypothetical protein